MSDIKLSEFKALISLLDDDDKEVASHVRNKLTALGKESLHLLESAREVEENEIIQERLEDLINKIQFDNIKDRLQCWLDSEDKDLLEGALIVNQIQYPYIDESLILQKINALAKAVWIELNAALSPLEEMQVVNQVFFQLHGYFSATNETSNHIDLSCINKVLETKKGNSLTLGILLLLIAQKNDLPIYGIDLPYHFILCFTKKHLSNEELNENLSENQVMFYINPLNKGIAFSRFEITNYLEQMKIKSKKNFYSPCNHIQIIKALIYNQLSSFESTHPKAVFLKELYDLL